MRGLFASLVVAIVFMIVALLAALLGSVGVAFIGSLLHRWFDLTQWQGTLIALALVFGLSFLIYRLAQAPAISPTWDDDFEEEEDEPEEAEPPIVPWRRSRPTQSVLPDSKPSYDSNKSGSSTKQRK